MTTYYVGSGGSDANAGTSWALRKATLNGAEDIPVAAGDTVYVGPGTYRETLTVDVSGTSGNPITYIADYTGANTDGTGGVVRITGSDNDQTAARSNVIYATGKNYRTFTGFLIDMGSGYNVQVEGGSTNWIIEDCYFGPAAGNSCVVFSGASQANHTVRRCYLFSQGGGTRGGILFIHTSTVDNCGHVVENCILHGLGRAIQSSRIGGITIRNCIITGSDAGVYTAIAALTAGQTVTVNNSIVSLNNVGFSSAALGDIVENYNAVFDNATARTNTATGANSNGYPPLLDTRWFFEATLGGGTLITPWDFASYSALVELNSGTGAPSADMRGTTVQSTYREWGPLEYDSTLDIEAGGAAGGMGGIFGSIVR